MKKIVSLIIFGLLISCANNEDIIRKTFTDNESVTVNKIIEFYDDFIYSQTDKTYRIEKAYLDFLKKTIPLTIQSGDLSPLVPEKNDKLIFYRTLNRNALSEIYDITDTVVVFSRSSKEYEKIYRPFSFSLNYSGKYIDFLKKLSNRNSFFEDYYESIMVAGGISPVSFSLILTYYENIDFSRKEERLVYIITILELQENRIIK